MDKAFSPGGLRAVVELGLLSAPEAPVVRRAIVGDQPAAGDNSAPSKQRNCANELCAPADRLKIGSGPDLCATGGIEPEHVASCQQHKPQFGLKCGIIEILIGCAAEEHRAGHHVECVTENANRNEPMKVTISNAGAQAKHA